MDLMPRFSTNFNKALGQRLLEARGALSARNIATSAGIDHQLYIQIERGQEEATLPVITRLAIALCVSTDYLLGLDPEAEGPDAGIRNWLLNASALQGANRVVLAERLAKAEGEKEQLRSVMAELAACTTDLVATLDRVIDSNREAFKDLKKGSALVSAAADTRTANTLALFFL